jgi:hypothetical protein
MIIDFNYIKPKSNSVKRCGMVTLSQLSSSIWAVYGTVMSILSFSYAVSFLIRKRYKVTSFNRFIAFFCYFIISLIILSMTIGFFYDEIGNRKMFDLYGNLAFYLGIALLSLFPISIILRKMRDI